MVLYLLCFIKCGLSAPVSWLGVASDPWGLCPSCKLLFAAQPDHKCFKLRHTSDLCIEPFYRHIFPRSVAEPYRQHSFLHLATTLCKRWRFVSAVGDSSQTPGKCQVDMKTASLSGFVSSPLILMMHPCLNRIWRLWRISSPHQSVKEKAAVALPDCSSMYECRNHGGCNRLRVFRAMTNGCN